MNINFVTGLLLAASIQLTPAAESLLTPVADPKSILADLQRKMSSLTSVYFEFTQERQLKLFTNR